jgi:hypothetical protein
VYEAWEGWLRQIMRPASGDPVPQTPGFPSVQWVCVPGLPGGYAEQWQRAQRLLAARRRVRDFAAVPEEDWQQRMLCSQAPRWPAERKAPPGVPPYEQRMPLSAVGWVKRRWRYLHETSGFPSTASIASALYRRAVLRNLADPEVAAAVRDLDHARQATEHVLGIAGRETPVPGFGPLIPADASGAWLARSGGPWVYPERWRPETLAREAAADLARGELAEATRFERASHDGYRAACWLRKLMEQPARQAPSPAGYLAVVVQDLDSMGLFLSGSVGVASGQKIRIGPNEHGRVSRCFLHVAHGDYRCPRNRELTSCGWRLHRSPGAGDRHGTAYRLTSSLRATAIASSVFARSVARCRLPRRNPGLFGCDIGGVSLFFRHRKR